MAREKSLEELLRAFRPDIGVELYADQAEMARRLRKLAKWADPTRHGHSTEKAAAEVRNLLEGRDD